ncbi:MAG TPA: hypothetical protein VG965_02390 [Patescibacteria group bacterium]|nr:hypothetical protein [Patescibacteria group bacterium]
MQTPQEILNQWEVKLGEPAYPAYLVIKVLETKLQKRSADRLPDAREYLRTHHVMAYDHGIETRSAQRPTGLNAFIVKSAIFSVVDVLGLKLRGSNTKLIVDIMSAWNEEFPVIPPNDEGDDLPPNPNV